MHIRTRLLLLVLAVMTPCLLGAAFGISYAYREALASLPVTAFLNQAPTLEQIFFFTAQHNAIENSAYTATVLLWAVALLLTGLATLAALVVARTTASPIEALRLSAERLGSGYPVQPVKSGTIEIDAVNDAMARAAEEIRAARADLEQRVADAVASAERSQRALLQAQKLEALGRLTSGITHDFNNVLQTVSTGLELAELGSTDPKVLSSLESCKRAVRHAAELTGQLTSFVRVQDARLETVNPHRQLKEMSALLCCGLRRDIDFRLDAPQGLWPVVLDPLQFELALLNLTINARDAMPQGGVLQLQARNETLHLPLDDLPAGDYVRILVSDTGEGMSADVLARAFDPFFTTKAVGKGTGMGLPQAYGFARQTGGMLFLRSKPGAGTQATLYLPRASRSSATTAPAIVPKARPTPVSLSVLHDALQ